MGTLRAGDLKQNPKNPRKITDERLLLLKKSMDEYGDISCVCFNVKTGNLFGGGQRSKNFDENAKVTITKRFPKATKKGTVAVGYILHDGERFNYREVSWPKKKETAAMLAANKNAGNWDQESLTAHLRELASFDVDFDLELTMFDDFELEAMGIGVPAPESEEDGEKGKDKNLEKSPSKMVHECPRCGYEFQ